MKALVLLLSKKLNCQMNVKVQSIKNEMNAESVVKPRTASLVPQVVHTCYRMQGCVIHRGMNIVGQEPSWCRLNSEDHKALVPFFSPS